MIYNVLAVTSITGFGKLLQNALGETGRYRVVIAQGLHEALLLGREIAFDLAILDNRQGKSGLQEIIEVLPSYSAKIRILVIASDIELDEPVELNLSPEMILTEPFSPSDLQRKVAELLLNDNLTEVASTLNAQEFVGPSPQSQLDNSLLGAIPDLTRTQDGLEDNQLVAQRLASLSMSTSAQAALILRESELWSFAGQLSQPAVQELAHWVNTYWSPESRGDLARFIKLDASGIEYMLYITHLHEGFILALAFDTRTPFNHVRSQVNQVARALIISPESKIIDANTSAVSEWAFSGDSMGRESLPIEIKPLFSLDEVPAPTPGVSLSQKQPSQINLDDDKGMFDQLLSENNIGLVEREEVVEGKNNLTFKFPFKLKKDSERTLLVDKANLADQLEKLSPENHSWVTSGPADDVTTPLEPISSSLYSLHYAFMLIPRMPEHDLAGDLATRLSGHIRQLAIVFDWRLVYLKIQPDYCTWIASVPPDVSPGSLIRTIRQHTSQRIFSEFPRLAQENPSGNFWAPGYLIMSIEKSIPTTVIQQFITKIRRSRDISHS